MDAVDAPVVVVGAGQAGLATGYHLRPLRLRDRHGHVATDPQHPTQSVTEPRLHLVGYGDWTGPASATLIGVGRTARDAVAQVVAPLGR